MKNRASTLALKLWLKNRRSKIDKWRGNRKSGINRFEFRVFSQHREDGIIENIINLAGISNKTCVEFGFGPSQCNCLNLVINHGFRGLFLDGNASKTRELESYFQKSGYPASAVEVFLNTDNINQAIRDAGFTGKTGVLSIDVDGNDYWLWQALTAVSADLAVIEYNASFGRNRKITVPYEPDFVRYEKHDSGFYHGASLAALAVLGREKGYSLIGCDSTGVNAFFLKDELITNEIEEIRSISSEKAFFDQRSRTKYKSLSPEQQWNTISSMPFVEIQDK